MSTAVVTKADTLRSLTDYAGALRAGLLSLEGKSLRGGHELYTAHTAKFLHTTLEGYLHLRGAGLIDASKQLVRPALEMMFRLRALHLHPELIFRYAYAEYKEDRKWANALHGPKKTQTVASVEANWTEFKTAFGETLSEAPAEEQDLKVSDIAQLADLSFYYDSHYRLYCRFTHAALRASSGEMALFEPEDNRTMAFCALVAMEALEPLGAKIPNLRHFQEHIHTLPSVPPTS